jgi:hypothetical protein
MAPSTESRLPFEGLICPAREIFPVASNASDEHHSLVLLIGGLLVAQPCSDPRPSRLVTCDGHHSVLPGSVLCSHGTVVPGGAMTTYLL